MCQVKSFLYCFYLKVINEKDETYFFSLLFFSCDGKDRLDDVMKRLVKGRKEGRKKKEGKKEGKTEGRKKRKVRRKERRKKKKEGRKE